MTNPSREESETTSTSASRYSMAKEVPDSKASGTAGPSQRLQKEITIGDEAIYHSSRRVLMVIGTKERYKRR